jgi:hypothetical protein
MTAQSCPDQCPARLLDRKPERLVVTGLRCCMAGYAYGDVDCWETAWRAYCGEVGTADARRLMGELQFWVRTLRAESARSIDLFPHGCGNVCRDECMALSLIAALQDHDEPTAYLAAHHLAGDIGEEPRRAVVGSGRSYAEMLAASGQKLLSVPPSVVLAIAAHGSEFCPARPVLH